MIYVDAFRPFSCTQFYLPSYVRLESIDTAVLDARLVILVNMPPCCLIPKYSSFLFDSMDTDSFSLNNSSFIDNVHEMRAGLI